MLGCITRRHIGRWIDWQAVVGGRNRTVVLHAAVFRNRIPHGERDAEKTLAADAPVTVQPVRPVFEARLHVGWMHRSSRPRARSSSRNSTVLINHCRLVT